MRQLAEYQPTRFMAESSRYDKRRADFAVAFIEALKHTKGRWSGKPFKLIDWQEQIIRDLFGTLKADGYRQFTTAYVEIPKKHCCSRAPMARNALKFMGVLPIGNKHPSCSKWQPTW